MKTFFTILLFTVIQPQVKQYRIYEAEEGDSKYLVNGYMAFTSKHVYLKLDTIYTFHVQKCFNHNGHFINKVGYDTLYNGEYYSLYSGLIVVMPSGVDHEKNREYGSILVECMTIRKHRRVIYKYK